MPSRYLYSPWGLLLLWTLWGMDGQTAPRQGRLSASLHRTTLSPARRLPNPKTEREHLRVTAPVRAFPGKKKPGFSTSFSKKPVPRPTLATKIASPPVEEREPPPLGEIAVMWARPRLPALPVNIFAAPSFAAHVIGELRANSSMLVGQQSTVHGGLCANWFSALPSGFVCAAQITVENGYLSSPPAREKSSGWQRFKYGVVSAFITRIQGSGGRYLRKILHRGDGVTVAKTQGDAVELIGKERLARRDVALVEPPNVPAVDLSGIPPGTSLAWVVPPVGEDTVPLFVSKQDKHPVAQLPRYSIAYVVGANPDQTTRQTVLLPELSKKVLLASDAKKPAWISTQQFEVETQKLRRVSPVSPPPGVSAEERWIDIFLREQVATAYQGEKPLFAALVSTGTSGATPPGSFTIYRKYLTQTMANLAGAPSQYDFREVPHAQFFNGRIGFHAVLWHDKLGHPVSHGCVNLSPAAAEQFFGFTSPELPTGWHTITTPKRSIGPTSAPGRTQTQLPGTRVIVRP